MEKILNILSTFFENPKKEFYIRELAKILKTNHTTVRNYLKKLEKENFLIMNNTGLYPSYRVNLKKKALNLKLFYNIEKLRKSNLIEDLELSLISLIYKKDKAQFCSLLGNFLFLIS